MLYSRLNFFLSLLKPFSFNCSFKAENKLLNGRYNKLMTLCLESYLRLELNHLNN